jgi:hypothetical protein
MRKFPEYETHEDVKCFCCGDSLKYAELLTKKYSNVNGHHCKKCDKCETFSYYYLKKKKGE